jgi:hypothetical protein
MFIATPRNSIKFMFSHHHYCGQPEQRNPANRVFPELKVGVDPLEINEKSGKSRTLLRRYAGLGPPFSEPNGPLCSS